MKTVLSENKFETLSILRQAEPNQHLIMINQSKFLDTASINTTEVPDTRLENS